MAQAASLVFTGLTTAGVAKNANGVSVIAAPGGAPFATYALQVKGTGAAPTSFSVTLDGSLDGVNWTTICTNTADGTVVFDTAGKPTLFVRANVGAVTLGSATDLTVRAIAVP